LLLDRLGRRRVLVWASLLNALSFLPFLLVDRTGALLWTFTIVHMVLGGALFASYFTYAADVIPSGRRVEGLAIFGVAGMAPNGVGAAARADALAPVRVSAVFFNSAR